MGEERMIPSAACYCVDSGQLCPRWQSLIDQADSRPGRLACGQNVAIPRIMTAHVLAKKV